MKKFTIFFIIILFIISPAKADEGNTHSINSNTTSISEGFGKLWKETGIYRFLHPKTDHEKLIDYQNAKEKQIEREKADQEKKISLSNDSKIHEGLGQIIMIGVGMLLIYLAISKGFEPLLLIPIGFVDFFISFSKI